MARPETVLVTGASGGIGSAAARAFASRGARLALHAYTRPQVVEALARELGGGAAAFAADLATAEGCGTLAKAVLGWAGGAPAGIVHAAGGTRDAPLPRLSEADWDRVLGVHLSAARRLVRDLGVAPGGFVVLLGSGAGRHGRAGQAAYAAAKAGLEAMAEALARELGRDGVRVNLVLPGPVATGMLRRLDERTKADLAAGSVLARPNTPDDVAAFIVRLAAMPATSGQVLDLGSRVPGPW